MLPEDNRKEWIQPPLSPDLSSKLSLGGRAIAWGEEHLRRTDGAGVKDQVLWQQDKPTALLSLGLDRNGVSTLVVIGINPRGRMSNTQLVVQREEGDLFFYQICFKKTPKMPVSFREFDISDRVLDGDGVNDSLGIDLGDDGLFSGKVGGNLDKWIKTGGSINAQTAGKFLKKYCFGSCVL